MKQGKRGKNPKTKSRNLLDRFIEYKEPILRFLTDLKVPFENNQAERDIRMIKLQQKISGTFRAYKERKLSAELGRIFLQAKRMITYFREYSRGAQWSAVNYTLNSYHS